MVFLQLAHTIVYFLSLIFKLPISYYKLISVYFINPSNFFTHFSTKVNPFSTYMSMTVAVAVVGRRFDSGLLHFAHGRQLL